MRIMKPGEIPDAPTPIYTDPADSGKGTLCFGNPTNFFKETWTQELSNPQQVMDILGVKYD